MPRERHLLERLVESLTDKLQRSPTLREMLPGEMLIIKELMPGVDFRQQQPKEPKG